jgi:signal transduction histidine kinase
LTAIPTGCLPVWRCAPTGSCRRRCRTLFGIAGAVPAKVYIQVSDSALEVAVKNVRPQRPSPQAPAGEGRGLAGMRERVAVFDGRLETGPLPDGGFAVHAILPLGRQ